MSTFRDSAIVLKIQKKQDKNFIYTLFSLKFGKITAVKKISNKEKNLDLGFHINYEIKTSDKINKISNIKIINEFNSQNKNFEEINNYLILLSIILKKTPFGVENPEIFEIINIINKLDIIDIDLKILLGQLKIVNILGELDINNTNPIILKILKFISQNNFGKIIKLTGIDNNIKKELQDIL